MNARRSTDVNEKRDFFVMRMFVVAIAMPLAVCVPIGAEPYFVEDFNSGLPNSSLEGYENFTLADGVIRSDGMISDHNDRRYIRTVATDYNTRDFRYELTFTTTLQNQVGIQYMGIGTGDRNEPYGYNEPWESLYFRVHTPNVSNGFVGVANAPVNDVVILGNIPNEGTHRARIEKIGSAITFALDRYYDGTFVADMSHTFPDITTVAPFLTNQKSTLFFGTAFPEDYFDDMLVEPIFPLGDYNRNGTVEIGDYTVWRDQFGTFVDAGTGGDGNNNGVVDSFDRLIWQENFGETNLAVGTVVIPEPTAIALSAIGAVAMIVAYFRSSPTAQPMN